MESTNNFCSSCGMKLEPGDKACPICGTAASKGASTPSMPESPLIAPAPEIPPVDFSQTGSDTVPDAPTVPLTGQPVAPVAPPVTETAAPASVGYTQPLSPANEPAAPVPGAPTGASQPQQPGYGYQPPAQGYSAPVAGGPAQPQPGAPVYGQPAGQGGYSPPPQFPQQPIPQPVAPVPAKKSSKPAVITAIVLVIAIAVGIIIYFAARGGSGANSDQPMQILGEVELIYDDDNDYVFSFTAENTTKETITYFEVWVYAYDANGNPVLDGYNSNWNCYLADIYLRPGAKHTSDEHGYWFAPSEDAAYLYCYIAYAEFLNGDSTGLGLYSDVADEVYIGRVDDIQEQADAWIAEKVR